MSNEYVELLTMVFTGSVKLRGVHKLFLGNFGVLFCHCGGGALIVRLLNSNRELLMGLHLLFPLAVWGLIKLLVVTTQISLLKVVAV